MGIKPVAKAMVDRVDSAVEAEAELQVVEVRALMPAEEAIGVEIVVLVVAAVVVAVYQITDSSGLSEIGRGEVVLRCKS